MSSVPQQDQKSSNLNLSLPIKPIVSTARSSRHSSVTTLPAKPKLALPDRPTFGLSSARTDKLHSSRPLSPPQRSRGQEHLHRNRRSRFSRSPSRLKSPIPPSYKRYHSPSPPRIDRNSNRLRSDRYQSPNRLGRSSRVLSPPHIASKEATRERQRSLSPQGRTRSRSSLSLSRSQVSQPKYLVSYREKDRDVLKAKSQQPLSLKDRLGGFFETETPKQIAFAKRPISPSEPSGQLKKQPTLSISRDACNKTSIPTGPRSGRIPTGPKSFQNSVHRLIPTGPSALRNQTTDTAQSADSSLCQLTSTQTGLPTPQPTPIQAGIAEDIDMGYGRRHKSQGKAGGPPSGKLALSPPLYDLEYISDTFGHGVVLKPQWLENPKSPLANFVQSGRGGMDVNSIYQFTEGVVNGQKVYRVTVIPTQGILGIGDSANKKEAEKFAALSAVLQLASNGLLEKGSASGVDGAALVGSKSPASALQINDAVKDISNSTETAKLSDGSVITYDRARQFMEYYCQRYRFRKPDIEFSQSTVKKGRKTSMIWDAVITVGDRRIGMGSASTKKTAQVQCYLDVTQYLESCDPDLWRDFIEYSKKDKSLNIGLAPHLVFQMSDGLIDDIQGLCGDIRFSQIWKNAPPPGVAGNESQPLPRWHSGEQYIPSGEELADKSHSLQQRLKEYEKEPRMAKMRKSRASLPVYLQAQKLLMEIEANDVSIIMAATGSGKTTQVPQLLFDAMIKKGEGAKCNIVCTQPRRLAAMSVAERIAEERGQAIGDEVGYQVRFDAQLPQPNGCITFCTTGIFLKRMQSALGDTADPAAVTRMDEISHVVVDEVHERDIDTDLLLVVLKRLLSDRKRRGIPIKVVLMSATIDPTLFQSYFADANNYAPVAEVPGRTYPVEKFYLDNLIPKLQNTPSNSSSWVFREKNVKEYLSKELSQQPANFMKDTGIELEIPYALVALTVAFVISQSNDGHVLVFLPGWEEIKKVSTILMDSRKYPLLGMNFNDTSSFSIHYLHSTIPAAEQKEVFRTPPRGVRRIILATNIAETSVTIPDVVYVVDTGRVKEKRYDPERHMSSLVSAWVGSSNLNQRAGRAGRHREGEYYGLVSKNRLQSLAPHQMVEMKRSDLSNVVMHVKALNLGEVETVLAATIEPPENSRIVAAMGVLRMLGALDAHQNLTSLGRVLLQLPVEASIGKLCLYGSFFRCLDSALTLAAVLTNRDPFLAPPAQKSLADEIKDSWSPTSFRSDPLAIVAAYNKWNELDERHRIRESNMFCDKNFLSKPTLLQIKQVKQSLLQSLNNAGVIAVSAGGTVDRIGKYGSILPQLNENNSSLPMLAALIATASAPNFAIRTSEKTCRTWQDKVVFIHNSSVNARRRETGGPEEPSASFNPAEKRLYAFGEKSRNVPLGGKPNAGQTNLRTVTRLDPMTYMLFGAYELVVTRRGLECDGWLPVFGNLHALDDIQRLKALLDGCLLRVFEGLGKSLVMGRDKRWRDGFESAQVTQDNLRIGEGSVEENESDDELYDKGKGDKSKSRYSGPLSIDEIKELELLTTDIVRILDAYAAEREGLDVTRPNTRPNTRPASPSPAAKWAQTVTSAVPGGAQWGDVNDAWGAPNAGSSTEISGWDDYKAPKRNHGERRDDSGGWGS
ncbi:hypothetical protein L204_104579 [Cryptococcus depauperatus]